MFDTPKLQKKESKVRPRVFCTSLLFHDPYKLQFIRSPRPGEGRPKPFCFGLHRYHRVVSSSRYSAETVPTTTCGLLRFDPLKGSVLVMLGVVNGNKNTEEPITKHAVVVAVVAVVVVAVVAVVAVVFVNVVVV